MVILETFGDVKETSFLIIKMYGRSEEYFQHATVHPWVISF